jgi:hypothetical protein
MFLWQKLVPKLATFVNWPEKQTLQDTKPEKEKKRTKTSFRSQLLRAYKVVSHQHPHHHTRLMMMPRGHHHDPLPFFWPCIACKAATCLQEELSLQAGQG